MDSLAVGTGEGADLLWTVIVAVAMVLGLFGVVLPVLPGLVLIWGAAVVYGLIVGFNTIGWVVIAILSALTVVSIVKGFVIPRRAAVDSGASTRAQVGAVVGGLIGFFIIPVFGLIIGALAGLVLVEYQLKGDWNAAMTAAKGTARGFGISVLIDLCLGIVMIVTWSIWAASILL